MKLYKYVTAEAGIGILRQWKIRFTPPACFNDPFEMRPYFLRPEGERFKAEATEIIQEAAKRALSQLLTPLSEGWQSALIPR